MVDKTIKNIKKKNFKALERILTAKIANIKNFYLFIFFVFPICKRVKYKNESNIS